MGSRIEWQCVRPAGAAGSRRRILTDVLADANEV
jgi:hypothetical protein